MPNFENAWDEFVEQTFHQKSQQRAYGAGRTAHLKSLSDKMLFIAIYFRLYPTQAVQGFLFGMSQAQAHAWVHRLSCILNQALGYEQELPEREPWKLSQVLSACPSLEFMIDGTERPINRPKDKEDCKTYYSGKKKAHTVKNNVISERKGKVLFLSDTYEEKA